MKGVIRSACISYLLCTILLCTESVEIIPDPNMQTGQSSYIVCEIGTRTGGVNFFTRPAENKGGCFGSNGPCSSSIPGYNIDHNSSTIVLRIAEVDCQRETGDWYCQHNGINSNSDVWLNCSNILKSGNLSYNGLKEDINTGNTKQQVLKMVISCSNPAPVNITWQYKSNMQPTLKDIPQSAVSVMSQETYDGTTCNPGEKFTISTMTASHTDEEFCGKKDVIFSVKYYDLMEESVDPVSFDATCPNGTLSTPHPDNSTTTATLSTTTTPKPHPQNLELIILLCVLIPVFVLVVIISIYCCVKRKRTKSSNQIT